MKEVVEELISKEEIEKRINEIAAELNKKYEGKTLHMICILKGSVFFFTELAKRLTIPVTMDFMSASSYGNYTTAGELTIHKDLDEDLEGLHCLIVEDIIDTGSTIDMIKRIVTARHPASVEVCTLLDKPDRRETEVSFEYTGFVVPDKFVVGFGLDYAQRYRNLPYVGVLNFVED